VETHKAATAIAVARAKRINSTATTLIRGASGQDRRESLQ
jgi:hypothetical protein